MFVRERAFSVALTQRFLALCEHHGSQHLVVKLVAVGRGTGIPGLPESDDWTTWDAGEMRAAVEYLVVGYFGDRPFEPGVPGSPKRAAQITQAEAPKKKASM